MGSLRFVFRARSTTARLCAQKTALVIIVAKPATSTLVAQGEQRVKSFVLAALLVASLAGCSVATRMGMRPATAPAYLVLGGQLYTGEAQGFADRRASIALHTEDTPALNCTGTLAFTAERSGVVELACSNGAQARLAFQSTDWATGFAYNLPGAEPASLTFGLTPDAASAYLRAPQGKKLVASPEGLKLE
jgi:hypothetical protein